MKKYTLSKQDVKTVQLKPSRSAATELAVIARTVEKLEADPKALLGVMQRAGIVTEDGKITKEYGG